MSRRTQEAIALVRAGDKVEAAALLVGWKGKRHLYREVKRLTGMTPAALRVEAGASKTKTDDVIAMTDEKHRPAFVPLKSVARGAAPDPAEALAEIRRIYFKTSQKTIEHDFAHAIELLKSLPDEEIRQKAHVYMEGLAEMRKEWAPKAARRKSKR